MLMHLSTAVEIAASNSHLAEIAIADIAAALRERAGEQEPAFSTRKIIEASFDDVVVTGATLPSGVFGALSRTDDGPVILYAHGIGAAKQRLAIAHELAHFLFDGIEACRSATRPCDPIAESRADLFADELLVPLIELRPYVCRWPSVESDREIYLDMVDEISSHFGVPADVIDRRVRLLEWLVVKHA